MVKILKNNCHQLITRHGVVVASTALPGYGTVQQYTLWVNGGKLNKDIGYGQDIYFWCKKAKSKQVSVVVVMDEFIPHHYIVVTLCMCRFLPQKNTSRVTLK